MFKIGFNKKFFVYVVCAILIIINAFYIFDVFFRPQKIKSNIFVTQKDMHHIKYDEVVVNLEGRLGNNMFQYATVYAYAKRHQKKFFLHGNKIRNLIDAFNVSEDVIIKKDLFSFHVFKETNRKLDFQNEMYNQSYAHLMGFFQNEKFFKHYREDILKLFEFKKTLEGKNLILADEIKSLNSVSVHIRRGDYLKAAKSDMLSNHYYLLSMDYIAQKIENPHFYVFSDDIKWVKDNLKIPYAHTFVDNNQGKNYVHDMHLMSLCKHNIIANSTFSWWGAWLNQNPTKIVIAPNVWLSSKRAYEDTKNIVPAEWIKLKEKADIAIVYLNGDENFKLKKKNNMFLPFDRKEFFVYDGLISLFSDKNKFEKFDYIILLKEDIFLEGEINYDIIPYEEPLYLRYNEEKKKFEKTSFDEAEMVTLKNKDFKQLEINNLIFR